MADGMREKTTNVGGVIKRIWYAMTGATQGAQLLSLDDAGNLEGKLLNPAINGTATGTAVTTTGEDGKLVKTSASGQITLINNDNTSASGVSLKSDLVNNGVLKAYGSGITSALFGTTLTNKIGLIASGADNTGLLIGTTMPQPLILGTGNIARITIPGNGSKLTATLPIVLDTGTGDSLLLGTVDGAGLVSVRTPTGVESIRLDGSAGTIKGQFRLSALSTPPASATATGTLGEIRIDANYIYICTATNTWKRTALTTW